jgi:hypothetical protein
MAVGSLVLLVLLLLLQRLCNVTWVHV